ncbi:hypothetical protein JVU11DRAFT_10729 [Chiua virens]|nr:hypothetical protein JVU11DRAFT_10729 [Chiua virens]
MARPGRPKLYHTPADQLHARRLHSQKYYARNCERISEKNKQRYRERQQCLKLNTVSAVEVALMAIIKGSLTTFLDCTLQSHDTFSRIGECLSHTLKQAEDIRGYTHDIHAKVLQVHGVSTELRCVEVTSCRVRQVIQSVEDVLLNLEDSVEMHCGGQLAYQSLPDVVPVV